MQEKSNTVEQTASPTPGPWRHDMQAGVVWGPDDREIVNLLLAKSLQGGYQLYDEERTEANARLIASSPTLLAAAIRATELINPLTPELAEASSVLLAAIAIAEGRNV